MTGSGTEKWRREVLSHGTFADSVFLVNNKRWLFENVDVRYSVALVVIAKEPGQDRIQFSGPFYNHEEFDRGRDTPAAISKDEFLSWTGTAAFPYLIDEKAASLFRKMRAHPAFRSDIGFEFRPVQGDLNSAANRDLFDTDLNTRDTEFPVLTGSSFNLWSPDGGLPYGYANSRAIPFLMDKATRAAGHQRSAFFGLEIQDAADLPMNRARIAFRDVTSPTNTRSMVCCLIPPGSLLVHKAPYLLRLDGTESDESYVLGVLSSRVFDWYVRRLVELAMTFELLAPMPLPRPEQSDGLRGQVIEIAGRLAAVDERYGEWASAIGVPVGSVETDEQRTSMEARLDALVAHLYALDRDEVEYIFATFHRGWDFQPQLEAVLRHFDEIEASE
jgi:hypothetical protein